MKITALIKVWSGEEWLKACIASIYNHVYKIVIITSDVSWIGGKDNPSIPIIKEMAYCHDPEGKIIHINYNTSNQMEHCQYAYEYIKKELPETDYIQLIDSDELWDDNNYKKAIQFIKDNPGFDAYRTQMYTYIKRPYYRIDPIEPLKPVCFISTNRPDMGMEPRGCAIKPFKEMPDVYCHHFVFVRYHFNRVLEKLVQSHVSEKQPYEDMSKWIPEVWNKLPDVTASWTQKRGGFHPAIGFGKNWKSIKTVLLEELPEVLHNQRFPEILKYGV